MAFLLSIRLSLPLALSLTVYGSPSAPIPLQPASVKTKFVTRAVGTQNYRCDVKAGAWVFVEPEADLFDWKTGSKCGVHFFRDDGQGRRATWASLPGAEPASSVTVKLDRSLPSPGGADRNIDWLLTNTTSNVGGPGTLFGGVSNVVRANTVSGVAPPAGECQHDAEIVKVPYKAVYLFYEPLQHQ
mmetsp:Transcript_50241/g.144527  ORF Transcript_50241/g.144527 Transcript_50241/m.144527 type:complete len:186 (-) Transcript_50241:358-915(-)